MNTTDKSPTADVYAGDTASLAAVGATDGAILRFTIEADAEPGTLARIINVLNIANQAPRRVNVEKRNTGILSIYIELTGIAPKTAHSIRGKLAQLTDVIDVDLGIFPPDDTGKHGQVETS